MKRPRERVCLAALVVAAPLTGCPGRSRVHDVGAGIDAPAVDRLAEVDAAEEPSGGYDTGVFPLDTWLVDRDATHSHADAGQGDVVGDGAPDAAVELRTLRFANGCDSTNGAAFDGTAMQQPVVIVAGSDFAFRPDCVRVRVGQTVVFRAGAGVTWQAHPLRAGVVVANVPMPDDGSPIPSVGSGSDDVTVVFTAPGTYGFYCAVHYWFGFYGAVFVAV